MARRKRGEEAHNHEAWAIPYGDLVTLLLAFFVVMYAISSVDDGKYRVLSDSLVDAFRASAITDPIQVGEPTLSQDHHLEDLRSLVPIEIQPGIVDEGIQPIDVALGHLIQDVSSDEDSQSQEQFFAELGQVIQELETAMAPLISEGSLRVNSAAYWLEIEITSQLLFDSGSATLGQEAENLLLEVGAILAPQVARVHVEGHTDNVPIQTSIYPSNWELSSGRAAAVVSVFERTGIDPENLVALGYGEHRPVASNQTPEGRAANRRVTIVLLPGTPPRVDEKYEPEQLCSGPPLPEDG